MARLSPYVKFQRKLGHARDTSWWVWHRIHNGRDRLTQLGHLWGQAKEHRRPGPIRDAIDAEIAQLEEQARKLSGEWCQLAGRIGELAELLGSKG